jgi:hypothetical protein
MAYYGYDRLDVQFMTLTSLSNRSIDRRGSRGSWQGGFKFINHMMFISLHIMCWNVFVKFVNFKSVQRLFSVSVLSVRINPTASLLSLPASERTSERAFPLKFEFKK